MSAAGDHLRGSKARSAVSGVPDMAAHVAFCRQAADSGIEHLLTAFGFHRADPVALAAALGPQTDKVSFLVATRSGVASPTLFAQQINSISTVAGGRVCMNMVAGHSPKEFLYYGDTLPADERYDRTDEFMTILRAFWAGNGPVNFSGKYYDIVDGQLNTPFVSPTQTRPEIYLGGKSARAIELAAKHADCLLTFPEAPETLAPKIQPLLAQNTAVGLIVSIIARETREEAIEAAYELIRPLGESSIKAHQDFAKGSVSEAFNQTLALGEKPEHWLTPWLWTGAVPYLGPTGISIVGSYDEVTDAFLAFQEIGVTEFLLKGWPDMDEMRIFGEHVLPNVRRKENGELRMENE